MTRIDLQDTRIVTTFPVVWDTTPAKDFGVVQMVIAKKTLWAFMVRFPRTFFDRDHVDFALAEIDMKTNSIRTIRQLGSGDLGSRLFAGQIFTVMDDDAWVCLPTGMYVIQIAETGH